MPKTKKSTKKFIKNKLQAVISSRKQQTKYSKNNTKSHSKSHSNDPTPEDVSQSESDFSSSEEQDDISDTQSVTSSSPDLDHQDELKNLSTFDPSFYQYLQENDTDLLNFNPSDGSDSESNQDSVENPDDDLTSDSSLLTLSTIQLWKESLESSHSLKTLKKITSALRSCAALGDDNDNHSVYTVTQGEIMDEIITISMEIIPQVLKHHLFINSSKASSNPSQSPKWNKLSPLVKSFLSSILLLLKQMTDSKVLSAIIRNCQNMGLYYTCFPKLSKEYIRQLVHFWSTGDEQVRVVAFLSIRQLAIDAPSYLDRCFKDSYKAFTQVSKNTSLFTWTLLNFMSSCLLELAGLDIMTTYQHGFVAIRELALLLRNAVNNPSKDTVKHVYAWNFLHRLKLWANILTNFAKAESGECLINLIYPLVQIALGVIRLKPSSKHYPMRFHIIHILLELSSKSGVFIPLASYVFEIFDCAEITSKSKPSTLKPLDFPMSIRAPNGYLKTRVYQTGLLEESVNILYDIFGSMALSISFPELCIPAVIQLKRLIKRSKNLSMNKQIQQLIEKLDQNSKFIESKRSNVDFSPKDLEASKLFSQGIEESESPLIKYVNSKNRIKAQLSKSTE